jgi:TetR/AcrR family transcriptional regulator, transcriptional repressor for nem operon
VSASKAEQTKNKILASAAELFNLQGYAGVSITEIMTATGLKKGGIYNYFSSKEELAIAAFDYAFDRVAKLQRNILREKKDAIERLLSLFDLYADFVDNPPIKGGCPLLNAAIDSDDTNPLLRDRVRLAMDSWQDLIRHIIKKGIQKGEIRVNISADEIATLIIVNLEGGIMMSKLYGDRVHLERSIEHLHNYLNDTLQLSTSRLE